jgi:hypothetical protein
MPASVKDIHEPIPYLCGGSRGRASRKRMCIEIPPCFVPGGYLANIRRRCLMQRAGATAGEIGSPTFAYVAVFPHPLLSFLVPCYPS